MATVVVGKSVVGGTVSGLFGVSFTSRYFLHEVNKTTVPNNIMMNFFIPVLLVVYNDNLMLAPTVLALGALCNSSPRMFPAPCVFTCGSLMAYGAKKNTLLANMESLIPLIFKFLIM